MKKFQNKYRIPSARLQNWDYGANGAYFITICTHKMQHYFGQVVNNEMHLNSLGQIAYDVWESIPNQFPYVALGNFVIMPNHMHGILIIEKKSVEPRFIAAHDIEARFIAADDIEARFIAADDIETRLIASVPRGFAGDENIEAQSIATTQEKGGFAGDMNPMLQDNISRIIRWYKGRCSFEMRKIHTDFNWHSRFYDHIIRNSSSFERIQNYIENNPLKWDEDKFYKEALV